MKNNNNQDFFDDIKKEIELYHKERNQVLGVAREILQNAKKAIFVLQAGDLKQAAKLILEAESFIAAQEKKYAHSSVLAQEGSWSASLEEFAEAKLFQAALTGKTLDCLSSKTFTFSTRIGALADLTGELVRAAVARATVGDFKTPEKYRAITAEVVRFFLDLYLTGYLRTKSDEAKRNLRRLEDMVYELSLKKRR